MLDSWWVVIPLLAAVVVSARLHRHRERLGPAWEMFLALTLLGALVAAFADAEAVGAVFIGLHVLVIAVGAWRVWGPAVPWRRRHRPPGDVVEPR